jgi:hypothetical protein
MRRAPFDHRICETPLTLVDGDDPFAHGDPVGEGDKPAIALDTSAGDELLREA